MRVSDKLRAKFSRFVGVAGFASLMSRALVMAQVDAPLLNGVQVRADGTFAGIPEFEQNPDSAKVQHAESVLLAQFLGLLVLFIGEALMFRMVLDIWPDLDNKRVKIPGGDHGNIR